MPLRVAVATRDGSTVQYHFGHAERFHVYDVAPGSIGLVDVRENVPSCQGGAGRDAAHARTLDLVADCDALVVAAVGPHALQLIEERGISCYQSEDLVPSVLAELAQLYAGAGAPNLQ